MRVAPELRTVTLQCPVDPEALRALRIGDLVFLGGPIFTAREGVYKRFLEDGIEPPVPWSELSNVNFHCSPAASVDEEGNYSVASVSATASFRFGKWMPAWLDRTGVKVILGKAGMPVDDYRKTFVPRGAVYLTTMGYGLGATYGRGIRGVLGVHWLEELGIAQAIWVLDCARMGPFLVEGDLEGKSLFDQANRAINERLADLYRDLPAPALRRYGETTSREDEVL
jgi:L(+)-tartrate dehydratase beta subunit